MLQSLAHLHLQGKGVCFNNVIFCTNETYKPESKGKGDIRKREKRVRTQIIIIHTLTPISTIAIPTSSDLTNNTVVKDLDLKLQHSLARDWKALTESSDCDNNDPSSKTYVVGSIEEAVDLVIAGSPLSPSNKVLVTGSLHLIGGVLKILGAEVQ